MIERAPRRRRVARAARDATRPLRWTARTAWLLLWLSPERAATARLLGRLWWRSRRRRRAERLELVRFRHDGRVLALWVSELSDLHVIREAFGDRVYALPDDLQARTILDLGAHIGASVLWFRLQFPDAEIHAVEPDRHSLEKLRRNVAGLSSVTVHHAAVAGEDGQRDFYEADQGWSSSLSAAAAAGGRSVRVRALALPALVRDCFGRERVDVLKLDIEGAEWEVMPRVRLAQLAEAVAGELHAGLLEDEAERDAWRHGLADFDVRFAGREGSGHFVALPRGRATPR